MSVGLKRPRSLLCWLLVYRLYLQAFPPSERKPFVIIFKMARKGTGDVWWLSVSGRFSGFCTTINGENAVLLDYLAVCETARGKGIGTQTLYALQRMYEGKGLFVEIESPFEPGDDQQDRVRRRQFYETCGMEPFGVMARVFGVNMELLGRGCRLDYAAYHAFYRDYYSQYAADHLQELPYPKA